MGGGTPGFFLLKWGPLQYVSFQNSSVKHTLGLFFWLLTWENKSIQHNPLQVPPAQNETNYLTVPGFILQDHPVLVWFREDDPAWTARFAVGSSIAAAQMLHLKQSKSMGKALRDHGKLFLSASGPLRDPRSG